ncbi:MAG: TetR/AcrR family transcriptional regulator [Sphingorhabdus sp.]|uniref:TetR/AcrR family transcriptional regulator n=1 Tax=Sphingorhabdus sp. TaxID=1902408 RepID=UPI0038FCEE25
MPSPRKTYHHGNLAADAVVLALDSIESGGESRLSVRALAESLGVAHRALYNHFGDRDGLLASLAAYGFDMLASAVAGQSSPFGFIRAYAEFAIARPELYALMMRQNYAAFASHGELREAADRMIAASSTLLASDVAEGDSEGSRRAVMAIWMLVHGGVTLHTSGVLRARSDAEFIDELVAISGVADEN